MENNGSECLKRIEQIKIASHTYANQDKEVINTVIKKLQNNGVEPPYKVLDIGCGTGTVTKDRFSSNGKFSVLALDNNQKLIKYAKENNSSSNIHYFEQNIYNINVNIIGKFDIVFCSNVIHMLEKQNKALEKMWRCVSDPGCLIIRTKEDGQHIHYPTNECMNVLKIATEPIMPEQNHGRKLIKQLQKLKPKPEHTNINVKTYHTAGKTNQERLNYWTTFHAERLAFAQQKSSKSTSESYQKFYKYLERCGKELKNKFKTNEIFDSKTVPIGIAFKKTKIDIT